MFYSHRIRPGEEGYTEVAPTYLPPVERFLNIYPISGELLLLSGGDLTRKTLRAQLPTGSKDEYIEGDLLFVENVPDEDQSPTDPNADYCVQTVLEGHSYTEILLEKRIASAHAER